MTDTVMEVLMAETNTVCLCQKPEASEQKDMTLTRHRAGIDLSPAPYAREILKYDAGQIMMKQQCQ